MDQAEGDYMRKIAKKQAIKVNLKELVLVSTTLKVAELSKVKILHNNVDIIHVCYFKVVFEETPNYTSEQLVSGEFSKRFQLDGALRQSEYMMVI